MSVTDSDHAAQAEPFLEPGTAQPLGANWTGRGTNFAVLSAHAERIELCLFDESGRQETIRLELPSRTGDVWHGFLPARFAGPGALYGYRIHGPYHPAEGHRFNPAKLLIDPCALSLHGALEWHSSLNGAEPGNDMIADYSDSAAHVPKCRIVDTAFDWGAERRPSVPWRDTIIYELHVKGFTRLHPGVPEHLRGRYLGLAQPVVIDYLKKLGITTVELMPCQSFVSEGFLAKRGLSNYWGYNPLGWYAPEERYAFQEPVAEFKTMVRALHEAGLEVILDVVFNHTAEGNELGPTLSLRGFDNRLYYWLVPNHLAHYENFSGCGNTVRFDRPAVRALVLDCLRYWVQEMHVDGFRFDLGPVVGRDRSGYNMNAPFFAALRSDPVLSYVKLIAEPWDVGPGGYQLGHFPAGWSEWNDRYRDTVRAFWRGDRPLVGTFAERFAGSSDLFRQHGRKPTASVNYVASHDGFTLHDTVAYNERHNDPNLENGADGHSHNLSNNYGVEGPTRDPALRELRLRQMRNMLATVFLSQGVPMLLAGDEFARTQHGNNNAYCQDNEISWVDWALAEENSDLLEFVRLLVDQRRSRLWLRRDTYLKGSGRGAARDVTWLHPSGREMTESDWNDASLACLAVLLGRPSLARGDAYGDLLVVFNAGLGEHELSLPATAQGSDWRIVFDTALTRPPAGAACLPSGSRLRVGARCTLLLESVAPSK
jgi:glycogen operon protein